MHNMDNNDQQLWDLLGAANRTKASEGFARSVLQRIALEEEQAKLDVSTRSFKKRKNRLPYLAWASTAGAAAVLCLALIFSERSNDSMNLAAEINDEVLLDLACSSLGEESLQDAIFRMASVDAEPLADQDIADILF